MTMLKVITICMLVLGFFCSNGPTNASSILDWYSEHEADTKDCPYEGKHITGNKLEKLLVSQEEWGNEYTIAESKEARKELLKDSRRIKLCGAVLIDADLSGYDLTRVNFTNANLSGANLSFSNLEFAQFAGAKLFKANLEHSDLNYAGFSKTDLTEANLSNAILHNTRIFYTSFKKANIVGADFLDAVFHYADFTNAIAHSAFFKDTSINNSEFRNAELSGTDFSDAYLINTSLANARVVNTDFNNVIYEIKTDSHPELRSLVYAFNLDKLKYWSNPASLFELRVLLNNSGIRNVEKKVTYALRHTERKLLWEKGFFNRLESGFKLIFFEVTTLWGMEPGRALKILILFIFIFWPAYVVVLYYPKEDGIWKHWYKDRSRLDLGSNTPQLVKLDLLNAIRVGLYFSILSAFHFGWRDLNVGNWIMRIQAKEFTLSATGWARSLSGLQSLISMYLLAIWVLTYFGRPFD